MKAFLDKQKISLWKCCGVKWAQKRPPKYNSLSNFHWVRAHWLENNKVYEPEKKFSRPLQPLIFLRRPPTKDVWPQFRRFPLSFSTAAGLRRQTKNFFSSLMPSPSLNTQRKPKSKSRTVKSGEMSDRKYVHSNFVVKIGL